MALANKPFERGRVKARPRPCRITCDLILNLYRDRSIPQRTKRTKNYVVDSYHENLPQPVFSLCATPLCSVFFGVYVAETFSDVTSRFQSALS